MMKKMIYSLKNQMVGVYYCSLMQSCDCIGVTEAMRFGAVK